MAVTKTDFINYSRCPRYIALDKIKEDRLDADISYEEYLEQETEEKIKELLGKMYQESTDEEDEPEVDLIDVTNRQLEAMLPYYKKVEELAGKIATKKFGGASIYAEATRNQECFDFSKNGIKYLCYVDIYNENEQGENIIEVKATTTNKFKSLGFKVNEEFYSIFEDIDNVLYLKDELPDFNLDEKSLQKYNNQKSKLYDRYNVGKYIYDLAVQRFIIEAELVNQPSRLSNLKYYLAVLNHEYTYDGTSDYEKDSYGNEIIKFIDLTLLTKDLQDKIKLDAGKIERTLFEPEAAECPLGVYCEYKKQTTCKFFNKICGEKIPYTNSSLNYMNNGHGFKTPSEEKLKGLELINAGYLNMLDIPEEWINKENHRIQREALKSNKPYIDYEKIKTGIEILEYPIYHLDFESMPCPIPRFRGEKPYTQSVFEFSLHIEKEPGICDKEKDNIVFLAESFNDEREKLIQTMLKYIDGDKGTLFAQNVSFEKSRIKELADIFPEYKSKLMKIYNRGFDLIWLVKTNAKLYADLGYEEEKAKAVNYYAKELSGSYSIKKTLPVFSDLSYANLDVKNGVDAVAEYASYPHLTYQEFKFKYKALVEYCKQDTWAMVLILDALRKLVEKLKLNNKKEQT